MRCCFLSFPRPSEKLSTEFEPTHERERLCQRALAPADYYFIIASLDLRMNRTNNSESSNTDSYIVEMN
jgi:hypothetical protein